MTARLGAALALLMVPPALSQELWNHHSQSILDAGFVSHAANSVVYALAEKYLAPTNISLGNVTLFESRADYDRVAPLGGSDSNYGDWVKRRTSSHVSDEGAACPAVSQATKLGLQIQIRSSSRDCHTTKEVWRRDPHIPVDGLVKGYDLLGISTAETFPRQGAADQSMHTEAFFRSSSKPTELAIRELLRKLMLLTHAGSLSVAVRTDAFFFREPTFSSFYPFDGRASAAPSRTALENSPEVHCVSLPSRTVACRSLPEGKQEIH